MSPAERLAALEKGENPLAVTRMKSGFLVLADSQFLPGYCILLAHPMVGKLNDLDGDARAQFLADMAAVGDALIEATGAVRANYAIYGNLDPFLHAHIWPRFSDEDESVRTLPPFLFPKEIREATEHRADPEKHGELMAAIRRALTSHSE